jgi:tripartite-type tricarboxylate transporter receptor subunit TctC
VVSAKEEYDSTAADQSFAQRALELEELTKHLEKEEARLMSSAKQVWTSSRRGLERMM